VYLRIAYAMHFLISATYIIYTVVYKSRSRDPGYARFDLILHVVG